MKSSNDYYNTLKTPQLPGYAFAEKLGSGSYATVYKAYKRPRQQEVVAVKCILRSSLNNISKENLLTEIELMKSFQHQHIVDLKDFAWDDNFIYLILEHCSGGDLMSYLKSHKVVSERVAKLFLRQLASALEYMRSKLVSHLDLKPSNILLASIHQPILKIADFGFAHYLNGTTEAMFLRGSLLYMAPEIVTKGAYNEKADLWSIGVILYECLFGQAPFASRTMRELEMKIISRDPIEIPPRSSSSTLISESCLDLLDGLLKRNMDERMGYDEFFNHPFVDLTHLPTKHSLQTACQLASRAVAMDSRKDYQSALKYYCDSIEYFMAAIQYEADISKKQAIRCKVADYIKRAEELKRLSGNENITTTSTMATTSKLDNTDDDVKHNTTTSPDEDPITQLLDMYRDEEKMTKALNVLKSAESREMSEDYKSALQRYEVGLGVLLKLSQDEPVSPRKDLLKSQMSVWMTRAERIKQYLILKESKMDENASDGMMEDIKNYSCLVQ